MHGMNEENMNMKSKTQELTKENVAVKSEMLELVQQNMDLKSEMKEIKDEHDENKRRVNEIDKESKDMAEKGRDAGAMDELSHRFEKDLDMVKRMNEDQHEKFRDLERRWEEREEELVRKVTESMMKTTK